MKAQAAPAAPALSTDVARPLFAWDQNATRGGWMAFAIGTSMFLSSIPGIRPELAGLSVHPYLILTVLALPLALSPRNRFLLRRGLGWRGGLFLLGLLLSTLFSESLLAGVQIYVKWLTVGLTFFVVERLVTTRRDYLLAVGGLVLGVCLIAIRGLYLYRLEPTYYLEILPGVGSRNVFSLWTLAPLAFALLIFSSKTSSRWVKLLMLAAVMTMMVPQVLSLSRSGWLLLAVTFFMVFAARLSFRLIFGLVLAAVVLQLAIEQFGFEERIESRLEDLRYGTESDALRGELIADSLLIFLDHPILGVSQADLPAALGGSLFRSATSTHNLAVDLLAGTGLAGFIPFLLCVLALYRRWRASGRAGWFKEQPELRRALPILLAAIAIRSLTSDEILFCPAIVFGLASTYGLLTSRPVMASAADRRLLPLAGNPGQRRRHDRPGATRNPAAPSAASAGG